MNAPEDPRKPPQGRPIPRPPQQPHRPTGPANQRPRPPEQPWYLEFRRPAPPPRTHRPPPGPRPLTPAPRPRPAQVSPDAAAQKPDLQRPSNRTLLITAGVTALLALGVLLAWVLRATVGDSEQIQLDVRAAQDGVRRVLTDPVNGYGRDDVTDVRCNNGVNPTVRRGASFTCAVLVDGALRQVLVEFADDAGTYAVDRPR